MNILLFIFFFTIKSFASDTTDRFLDLYSNDSDLNSTEIAKLSKTEIVLIPGIGSESFIWDDARGVVDVSFIFKNYFGAQLAHYKKLGIPTRRLWASSFSVQETIDEIGKTLDELKKKNRQALFITHSLGGLALLDYLIAHDDHSAVKGIIFFQSPFYGSPIASTYFKNPYFVKTILGPMIPFLNFSPKTIRYLTMETRSLLMAKNQLRIGEITRTIPAITLHGKSFHHESLMRPTINIIGRGCVMSIRNRCLSARIFEGPYDDSDGMVPAESSKLPHVDYIGLEGIDHGETVLAMPGKSFDRVKLTDVSLKILLDKISPSL